MLQFRVRSQAGPTRPLGRGYRVEGLASGGDGSPRRFDRTRLRATAWGALLIVSAGAAGGAYVQWRLMRSRNAALVRALDKTEWRTVSRAIRKGADLELRASNQRTPLMVVARCSDADADAVRDLLEHGAKIDDRDNVGYTPLLHAAAYGNVSVLQVLLDGGADPNAHNGAYTPLVASARAGRVEKVRALLAAGAEVNASTPSGHTALHEAAVRGHAEVVRALLAAGADANAQDASGSTALTLAKRRGHAAVVRVLTPSGGA